MPRAIARTFAAVVLLASLAACVITNPDPYSHGLLQPGYNKAWNNAVDAMKDEGLQVVMADVAGGRLEGRRGATTVNARVITQALGNVKTEFTAAGGTAEASQLAERVRQRYDARMASK